VSAKKKKEQKLIWRLFKQNLLLVSGFADGSGGGRRRRRQDRSVRSAVVFTTFFFCCLKRGEKNPISWWGLLCTLKGTKEGWINGFNFDWAIRGLDTDAVACKREASMLTPQMDECYEAFDYGKAIELGEKAIELWQRVEIKEKHFGAFCFGRSSRLLPRLMRARWRVCLRRTKFLPREERRAGPCSACSFVTSDCKSPKTLFFGHKLFWESASDCSALLLSRL